MSNSNIKILNSTNNAIEFEHAQEINNLMIKAEVSKAKENEYKKEYNELSDKIQDIMEINKLKECILSDTNITHDLSALVYSQTKIEFNYSAIKSNLLKQQLNLISDVLYIAEEAGLQEFMNKHPKSKSELKVFIRRVSTINDVKLNDAFKLGIIPRADMQGCYTNESSSKFKLQRVKKK